MDRVIRIPATVIQQALTNQAPRTCYLVAVNWPELRLTDDQMWANARAGVNGDPTPYPDPSLITIELER